MSSLTVTALTKAFGATPVLTGVDLHVPAGGLVALLGPSGCGKTTLLRLVAGFDDPDSGTVVLGDRVVAGSGRGVPARRRGIGFVPQEGGLFPHLSVAGNVTFGLPRQRRRDRGRVRELLDLVGLDAALADRSPHQLSGGQQQRVALARALAPEPSLVLLDEPFSSLDATLREDTRQAVSAALIAAGATALLVTHDQAEALSMADQVAVLRGGRLVQLSDPRTLYQRPADLDVAAFVGESVVLAADVRDGRAESVLGSLAVTGPAGPGPARVLLRPEQLRLVAPVGPVPRGRVRSVDFYGHDSRVRLDLPGGGTVTARLEGADLPSVGQDVGIEVSGAAVAFPAAEGAAGIAGPAVVAGPAGAAATRRRAVEPIS
ncbi:ABC transporter ATP-binding protein [Blastococcus saxobsidens]|uniref:ABC-type quaternary amine transporter n=1 Tax=Blastococcus saxobsidens (strain DD2) TaxID=1146883 RepID=H6RS59_BLASD|nr:ABC transporter ATP-binding protein [Blastococcus saxobsidens]CCG04253.1 Fe(3+) ions import ATP-binding protein FbpC 1 [Blastococcus saxobsidens DD2]